MSTIDTIITLLHTARYHFTNQLQFPTSYTKNNKLIQPPQTHDQKFLKFTPNQKKPDIKLFEHLNL